MDRHILKMGIFRKLAIGRVSYAPFIAISLVFERSGSVAALVWLG
jgi:hypothetical protein